MGVYLAGPVSDALQPAATHAFHDTEMLARLGLVPIPCTGSIDAFELLDNLLTRRVDHPAKQDYMLRLLCMSSKGACVPGSISFMRFMQYLSSASVATSVGEPGVHCARAQARSARLPCTISRQISLVDIGSLPEASN